MQKLDPSGQYTDDEVKAALSGSEGTRNWSFRYERLDSKNTYIEDIDFVDSCTIDNNIFADIKRTAKFQIHDEGNLNYLSDRIKPYARLDMPKEESYAEYMTTLRPDVWYRFDDPAQTEVLPVFAAIPEDLSHGTFATAYPLAEGRGYYPYIDKASATVRTTLWAKLDITNPNPINFLAGVNQAGNTLTVYRMPEGGTLEADLVLEGTYPSGTSFNLTDPLPDPQTLYLKLVCTGVAEYTYLEWEKPSRVYDSAFKGNHGISRGGTYRRPALVSDGGAAFKPGAYFLSKPQNNYTVNMAWGGSMWLKMDTASSMVEFTMDAKKDTTTRFSGVTVDSSGVTIRSSFNSWETAVRWNLPLAKTGPLTEIKHLAWTSDIRTGEATVWVNGKGHVVPMTVETGGYKDQYSPILDVQTVMYMNATGSVEIDDTTAFFSDELSDGKVRKLYKIGTQPYRNRTGYVEWPQGVFLLSSPTRTFADGNTASRDVEAYDQLLALKEDSYDYRYTAPKSGNCVDELRKVLGVSTVSSYVYDPLSESNKNSYTFTPSTANTTSAWVTRAEGGRALEIRQPSTPASAKIQMIYPVDVSVMGKNADIRARVRSNVNCTVELQLVAANGSLMRTSGTVALQAGKPLDIAQEWGRIPTFVAASATLNVLFTGMPTGSNITAATEYVFVGDEGSFDRFGSFYGNSADTNSTQFSWKGTAFASVSVAESKEHQITPSKQTFTEAIEWEPGTPKLQIVNDILAYINYESAWFDENGVFVGEPYLTPAQRSSQFTYATDENSVITSDNISQSLDLFAVPNKWVLISSEPDSVPMVGSYTNDDPLSPTSTIARGRTIVDYREEQSASDQATLDAKAERLAFEASQVYEQIEFTTGLMPIHSNSDTYDILIDELAIRNKYSETAWSISLDAGATMKHQVRKIVQV